MPTKPISLVRRAQQLIADVIKKGDIVVDATIGNGLDTLFLSNAVGPQGKVYGFDIQLNAIAKTRALLGQHDCLGNTYLNQSCHSNLSELLQSEVADRSVSAAMFNLGYLPGGNKTIITKGNTTVEAMNSLIPLLANKCCITILAYRGHPGGIEEADTIAHYCATLDKSVFRIDTQSVTHINNIPPILFSIHKNYD